MPPLDHDDYNSAKSIGTFVKLAQISLGTMVQSYSYHAIKRLIEVDSEEETIHAASEDPLATLLIEASKKLRHTERSGSIEFEVEPSVSLAVLFDSGSPLAKALKPKLFLAYDLRKDAAICGFCSVCAWSRDDSLGTDKFTHAYCRDHSLPRFDGSWLLVDVVASSKRMTGALLVLQAYLLACRQKHAGICAVAVTKGGKSLFQTLGFETHTFRDAGASKALVYARAGSLAMATIQKRLEYAGDKTVLSKVCWRFGLTAKTSDRLMTRCI